MKTYKSYFIETNKLDAIDKVEDMGVLKNYRIPAISTKLIFNRVDLNTDLPKHEELYDKPFSIKKIQFNKLIATQDHITKWRIIRYIHDKEVFNSINLLPQVVFKNSMYFIKDGHHRLAVNYFLNQRYPKVRVYEI